MTDPTPTSPAADVSPTVRLAAAVALLVVALLSVLPLRPPAPRSADSPAEGFSAARAFADVEALALAPRPVGSPAHAAARRHVVDRMRELELETRVQQARRVSDSGTTVVHVENVVARLAGSGGGPAVLLVAHYDSVAPSPGAADDAAGVATLMEVARALTAGTPPARDVIFLASDAEELGLYGAQAFLASDPWADDVGLVVNLEARGTAGPSIMFEPGAGGLAMIEELDASTPRPAAASYSIDVYRMLPNDTDFSVFRDAGLAGYNFAFIAEPRPYHTARDTPDRLDRGSLQHHGDNALGLVRHFAAGDLPKAPADGAAGSYFNLPGLGLVVLPLWLSWGTFVVAVVLLVLATFGALRRHGLRPAQLGLRFAAFPAIIVAAGLLGSVLGSFFLVFLDAAPREVGTAPLFQAAVAAFAALPLLAMAWLTERRGRPALALADALAFTWCWLLLSLVGLLLIPASSYLLVLPTTGAALGALLRVHLGGTSGRLLAAVLGAVPLLLLWIPFVLILGTALGVAGGLVLAVAVALALTLLAPTLRLLTSGRAVVALIAAAVVGTGLLVAALLATDRARSDSLVYLLDADTGSARWVSFDTEPSAWTRQVLELDDEGHGRRAPLEDFFAGEPLDVLSSDTEAVTLTPPRVEVVEEAATAGGRRLHLRATARPEAARLRLALRGDVRGLALPTAAGDSPAILRTAEGTQELTFHGGLKEGVEVLVETGPAPLEVTAVDRAYGLPAPGGRELEPRPPELDPSPSGLTDFTSVRRSFRFAADDTPTPPRPIDER